MTPKQLLALEVLLAGGTVAAAADAAGVTRQTVSGWRSEREFSDAYTDGLTDLAESSRQRARATIAASWDAVHGAVTGPDPDARLALDLLKLRTPAAVELTLTGERRIGLPLVEYVLDCEARGETPVLPERTGVIDLDSTSPLARVAAVLEREASPLPLTKPD